MEKEKKNIGFCFVLEEQKKKKEGAFSLKKRALEGLEVGTPILLKFHGDTPPLNRPKNFGYRAGVGQKHFFTVIFPNF